MLPSNPYFIGPGDLASMHAAQLAQFNVAFRSLFGRASEIRPPCFHRQPVTMNFAAFVQAIEIVQAIHSLEEHGSRLRADFKRGDCGRSRRVGKRLSRWLD